MAENLAEELNSTLESLREEFKSFNEDFSSLNEEIVSVSSLIESVSEPVKRLEQQRTNANAVIQKLNDLLNFQDLLRSFREAISKEQLQEAAQLSNQLSQISVPFHIPEVDAFNHLRSEISDQIKARFSEAILSNDRKNIEFLAGLFLPLGLGREGVDKYIEFISRSLGSSCKSTISLLADNTSVKKYEDALVNIYRSAVKTYETHKPTFAGEFGEHSVSEFLASIEKEAGQHASEVINQYIATKDSLHGHLKAISLDVKTADGRADVLCKLIKHSESFENYMQSNQPSEERTRASALKTKIQELVDFYISVESYFVVNSLKSGLTSLEAQEFAEENFEKKEILNVGKPFEVLDEVFYLIQRCSQRGMSTLNINAVCAIVNHIGALLSEEIIGCFEKAFVQARSSFTAKFNKQNAYFIVLLNLVDLTRSYSKKVVSQLESQFTQVYKDKKNENLMFSHCLQAVSDGSERARGIIQDRLKKVIKSAQNSISSLVSPFANMSFVLSEEDYMSFQVNDPYALKMLADVKTLLKQWRTQLSIENFEALLEYFTQAFTEGIEIALKGKRFNDFGILQFEKDVREMTSGLQGLTNKNLRQRFIKVKQILQVLQATSLEELQYMAQDKDWRLTEREVMVYSGLKVKN